MPPFMCVGAIKSKGAQGILYLQPLDFPAVERAESSTKNLSGETKNTTQLQAVGHLKA